MKSLSKAFTMIELIFVIVILGIIAATILPRMDKKTSNTQTTQNQPGKPISTSTWDE